MRVEFNVMIEADETGCSAHIEELPGCVATAETEDEVKQLIVEAAIMHLVALSEDQFSNVATFEPEYAYA